MREEHWIPHHGSSIPRNNPASVQAETSMTVGSQPGLKKPKSRTTFAMFASCVGTMHRWIQRKYPDEHRTIEDIPPIELDFYLAGFFQEVKKPSGTDYSPESLRTLRSYIQGYLETKNYPESITKSRTFLKSQQVYSHRRVQLRNKRSQLTMDN